MTGTETITCHHFFENIPSMVLTSRTLTDSQGFYFKFKSTLRKNDRINSLNTATVYQISEMGQSIYFRAKRHGDFHQFIMRPKAAKQPISAQCILNILLSTMNFVWDACAQNIYHKIPAKLQLFLAFSNLISLELTTCSHFSRKFTRVKTSQNGIYYRMTVLTYKFFFDFFYDLSPPP